MGAVKIVLQKVQRANGLYPLRLRVTKDRKSKFFKTIYQALPSQFNEKSEQFTKKYTDSVQHNRILLKIKARALKVYGDLHEENEGFSLLDFENAFINTAKPKNNGTNFFFFWNDMIQELIQAGRTGDARVHNEGFKALKKFNGGTRLQFEELNASYLSRFENHLRAIGGSDGGISIRMRSIRTTFNLAIARDFVSQDKYPFKKYKISKLKSNTAKRALDYFDVMKIINLDIIKYPHLSNSHNYFVFSFYTRGMNFTDQMSLKWSQVTENKIYYRRSKTKGDFNITILPPVQNILDYYEENSRGTKYVFPILLKDNLTPSQIENRKKKTRTKYNKDLKEIAQICGIKTNAAL